MQTPSNHRHAYKHACTRTCTPAIPQTDSPPQSRQSCLRTHARTTENHFQVGSRVLRCPNPLCCCMYATTNLASKAPNTFNAILKVVASPDRELMPYYNDTVSSSGKFRKAIAGHHFFFPIPFLLPTLLMVKQTHD